MRVAMFSTHAFDREFFDEANVGRGHDLHYLEARLTPATAALAKEFPAVCAFVNDQLSADVLTILASVSRA
jgi:D-lactate dehydrogenase